MNNSYNNINFTANYIRPAVIMKNDGKGEYHPYRVSVIELDRQNSGDIRALQKTALAWKDLASDIYCDFVCINSDCIDNNPHFFAITSQADDFKHLRHDEIMGLAEFEEDKKANTLVFLQVSPELNFASFNKAYKHIGTAMLNFLKTAFPKKYIKVYPLETAYDFYIKNEFKPVPKSSNRCLWNA